MTLREAWPQWLAAADVPDLKPARDQVYEHFYFAIQAAIEGLGVVMGPVALVANELRTGRLLAPLNEPALRTRGYFVYAHTRNGELPAIAAFRNWLVTAGSLAESVRTSVNPTEPSAPGLARSSSLFGSRDQ